MCRAVIVILLVADVLAPNRCQAINNHHADFILKIVFKFYINHVVYNALQPLNKLSWEVNSLWPSDALWRHRYWSTLAQVMACCLTAPSHYLNQCWLIVSTDQWRLSKDNFTRASIWLNKFRSNLPGANELKGHRPCDDFGFGGFIITVIMPYIWLQLICLISVEIY